MIKILDGLALVAYCGLIFWLSDQQRLPMPTAFEFQDKFLHTGAYWVMAILSWRALRHFGLSTKTLALVSFVFCSLYGITDEWHQSFVPGRESSHADWLADSIGAALAVILLSKSKLIRRFIG
ncbi:MAG: teicoplanin resistance protein VanZ [Methylomonas sp.]|jgi:VanZ family protein|nr:MAG: teicoplanin resistance protein VanZ [Methylomonas sp.]